MKLRTLDISYAQIAVFQSALADPFSDWTDRHLAQGFAWRPGSVSFATIEPSGPIEVEVVRGGPALAASSALRIIAVPFSIAEDGAVDVTSIGDGEMLTLPAGSYRLTFEHGLRDGGMWCRLSFEAVIGEVTPKVLRAGDLVPSEPLLMDASAAK
ncbi:MAG: competence protein ComJ [Myxococcota bacterium]